MTKRILLSLILWGGVVFNTLNAQKTLPYSYGFEFDGTYSTDAATTTLATEGWTLYNCPSGSTITQYVTKSGNKKFTFAKDNSLDPQYLISPKLNTNVSSLGVRVKLYHRLSGSAPVIIKIGFSTKDEETPDINNFTWSNDIYVSNSSGYDCSIKNFLSDGIKYIAIQYTKNSTSNNAYIDDISISELEYLQPQNLSVSSIVTSASLSWTAGNNENTWLLYYSTSNSVPSEDLISGAGVITINNISSHSLTGLTEGTTYYAWVRSNYGDNHYSDWTNDPVTFTPSSTGSLTLYDATTYNSYIPFYGFSAASASKGQFIIPSTVLTSMLGMEITKLAFETTIANKSWGDATWKIYMKEVNYTTFSSTDLISFDETDLCYSGSLSSNSSKIMEITLSNHYKYTGQNLLIYFCLNNTGTNTMVSFYGVASGTSTNYTSLYCYTSGGKETKNRIDWLPKTTFTYTYAKTLDSDGDWPTSSAPTSTDNVLIQNEITIADGTNATANIIALDGSSTLTIADGATLTCDNIIGATAANLVIADGAQIILPEDASVNATVKRSVTGSSKGDAVWEAFASTINNPAIGSTNLITGTYDLYMYKESADYEWINYKAHTSDFANLTNSRGYLYRNAATMDITIEGALNTSDISDYTLSRSGSDPSIIGFNFVGNPYQMDIYKGVAISNTYLETGYYVLVDGAWSVRNDDVAIAPGTGILVQAKDGGNGKNLNVTYTNASSKANHDNIMFTVENSECSDITYAMFDKGHGLNKISHRNANVPMLYIPQNDENFAIAMMNDDTKAFDLNFKAMTTGKYTLSCKTKGNYSYLHVIDRLTGEDVDMLLEGEYSFIASKQDNENRFIVRLEYSENPASFESSTFAWQNGSDIIVNGEGELQIFDVMGRRVSTMRVSGETTITAPSMHGVYIFKLNDKTQKIVVK